MDDYKEQIHDMRKEIDRCIRSVRLMAEKKPVMGGAELTLSFRNLQMAKMWLGKALEEAGSVLPPEYADNWDSDVGSNVGGAF